MPALALLTPSAIAQVAKPQTGTILPVEQVDPLKAWIDRFGRPTVEVMLNGRGPFHFLVDTGANKTVIAKRHVDELGIPYVGMTEVNGTTGVRDFPVARVQELVAGAAVKETLTVAVADDRYVLRESGILGADVFAGRRLNFNIAARTVSVERSKRSHWSFRRPNLTIRNGILAELRGRVGSVQARFMLDTGADDCILNPKLHQQLLAEYPRLPQYSEASVRGVTGHILKGTYVDLPEARFGRLNVNDVGGIVVDAPIFRLWGLEDEPTMIVGVNVLSRLNQFTIDYGAKVFEGTAMAMIAQRAVLTG